MKRVAIVGLGLIGGSLGLALKAHVPEMEVIGVARREETAAEARERGAVDRAGTDLGLIVQADLVVIACPLAVTAAVIEEAMPYLADGAHVTDVGSVKGAVVDHALSVLDPERNPFLGGHPMAGKEVGGIGNADPGLFRGRPWVLTPTGPIDAVWDEFLEAVRQVGGVPMFMPAAKHDRYVAMISHLPFLLSAAYLVSVAGEEDWEEAAELASSGFRDFSRLGAGDPEMYSAIAGLNREEVLRSWASLHEALDMFEAAMARGEESALLELFQSARGSRRAWADQHPGIA